jgi:hypothetical protein
LRALLYEIVSEAWANNKGVLGALGTVAAVVVLGPWLLLFRRLALWHQKDGSGAAVPALVGGGKAGNIRRENLPAGGRSSSIHEANKKKNKKRKTQKKQKRK